MEQVYELYSNNLSSVSRLIFYFLFADKMEKSSAPVPVKQKTYVYFILAGLSLCGLYMDFHFHICGLTQALLFIPEYDTLKISPG